MFVLVLVVCDIVVGLLIVDAVFNVDAIGLSEAFKRFVVPDKVENDNKTLFQPSYSYH